MQTPEQMAKNQFVSFDDQRIPLGKRKILFVKWLMSKKGKCLREAKLLCYRKFYKEEHRL